MQTYYNSELKLKNQSANKANAANNSNINSINKQENFDQKEIK